MYLSTGSAAILIETLDFHLFFPRY